MKTRPKRTHDSGEVAKKGKIHAHASTRPRREITQSSRARELASNYLLAGSSRGRVVIDRKRLVSCLVSVCPPQSSAYLFRAAGVRAVRLVNNERVFDRAGATRNLLGPFVAPSSFSLLSLLLKTLSNSLESAPGLGRRKRRLKR